MKKPFLITMLVLAFAFPLFAQQPSNPAGVILTNYATPPGSFTTGAIPKADLDTVIQAGVRAPSARNQQPWHFTVVQNLDLAKKMVPDTVQGNVLIVVSSAGDGKTNGVQILDCALAVQSIYLAAQSLGYGSRIYTGPMDSLNRTLKGDLSLPSGHNAIALVRIGKVAADAVSRASPRKAADAVVTYK